MKRLLAKGGEAGPQFIHDPELGKTQLPCAGVLCSNDGNVRAQLQVTYKQEQRIHHSIRSAQFDPQVVTGLLQAAEITLQSYGNCGIHQQVAITGTVESVGKTWRISDVDLYPRVYWEDTALAFAIGGNKYEIPITNLICEQRPVLQIQDNVVQIWQRGAYVKTEWTIADLYREMSEGALTMRGLVYKKQILVHRHASPILAEVARQLGVAHGLIKKIPKL